MVEAADVRAALARVLELTEQHQAELDQLDAIAGDGDHGVTLVLGWRAANLALRRSQPTTPGSALQTAAQAFATVGGSAGALWGSGLLGAGQALGEMAVIDRTAVAAASTAALEAMKSRGRCDEGESTILDALAPAARCLSEGGTLAQAAMAAARGAAGTADLEPRKGRASRSIVGPRGHVDPGAQGCALFFQAVSDCPNTSELPNRSIE